MVLRTRHKQTREEIYAEHFANATPEAREFMTMSLERAKFTPARKRPAQSPEFPRPQWPPLSEGVKPTSQPTLPSSNLNLTQPLHKRRKIVIVVDSDDELEVERAPETASPLTQSEVSYNDLPRSQLHGLIVSLQGASSRVATEQPKIDFCLGCHETFHDIRVHLFDLAKLEGTEHFKKCRAKKLQSEI